MVGCTKGVEAAAAGEKPRVCSVNMRKAAERWLPCSGKHTRFPWNYALWVQDQAELHCVSSHNHTAKLLCSRSKKGKPHTQEP